MSTKQQSTQRCGVQDTTTDAAYLPFRDEVFQNSTPNQRAILLAARDAVLRGGSTQSNIAAIAGVSPSYVTRALMKYVHREDLPAAYSVARNCIAWKDYRNITPLQRQIINDRIVNPDITQTEIAEHADCDPANVHHTLRVYHDIIQAKNPRDAPIDTPIEANDVPLDDLNKDSRSDVPVWTPEQQDLPQELFTAFSEELLLSLPTHKRRILLAAREWAIRGDVSIASVARTADVSHGCVDQTIRSFRHLDDEYPTAAAVAATYFEDFTYQNLPTTQYHLVNALVVNPDVSVTELSERENVTTSYVSRIKKQCRGIIQQQREIIGGSTDQTASV